MYGVADLASSSRLGLVKSAAVRARLMVVDVSYCRVLRLLIDGRNRVVMNSKTFQTIAWIFRSLKVEAFFRLWISSNLGCIHVPVGASEDTV